MLLWNTSAPADVVLENHDEQYTPRLGMMKATVGPYQQRHIVVRWPFTDERAEAFLRREARQLPTDAPGLIMIQTSGSCGFYERLACDHRAKSTTRIHTRVGAVCLFRRNARDERGEDLRSETRLIINPHRSVAIPEWIVNDLDRYDPTAPEV